MALTHQRAMEVATELKACADQLKAVFHRCRLALDTNSDLAVDWAGNPKPAYLNEDAAGNLDGFKFTRDQVANLVGSLDNFAKLLTNAAPTQGDHLGNLNAVCDAGVQS